MNHQSIRSAMFQILTVLLLPLTVNAEDLGFRFKGNKCVNAAGKEGLNPGYIGQCGDLRNVIVGLNMNGTDLSGAVLDEADLQRTTLNRAILNQTSFKGTNLSGVDMTNATIQNATFDRAIMRNVHLAGATVKGCSFAAADMSGIALSGLDLSGNQFVGANFNSAALDGANFSGVNFNGARLISANLKGARIENATLEKTDFTGADLSNANLKGAKGVGARFANGILRKSNLENVNLKEATFRGARMNGISLKSANVENSDMRRVDLTGAITEGANLRGVKITKSTILPFPMDEAVRQGMVDLGGGSVLVIWTRSNDNLGPFISGLQALGLDVDLSLHDTTTFTNDQDISKYLAVFHHSGKTFNVDMPAPGQKALVEYVKNGGTYIASGATVYTLSQNLYKELSEIVSLKFTRNFGNTNIATKVIPGFESHPVLEGFTLPLTVAASTYVQSTLIAFANNPAQVILTDAANMPIVAYREFGAGRAVTLGLCAPNDDTCLANVALQRMVANVTNW
jgi:uncharacterized protein YjbI with pentapeptide repeats